MKWIVRHRQRWKTYYVPEIIHDPIYGDRETGRYVKEQCCESYDYYICPICHKGDDEPVFMNYCPNCGADMR